MVEFVVSNAILVMIILILLWLACLSWNNNLTFGSWKYVVMYLVVVCMLLRNLVKFLDMFLLV